MFLGHPTGVRAARILNLNLHIRLEIRTYFQSRFLSVLVSEQT